MLRAPGQIAGVAQQKQLRPCCRAQPPVLHIRAPLSRWNSATIRHPSVGTHVAADASSSAGGDPWGKSQEQVWKSSFV